MPRFSAFLRWSDALEEIWSSCLLNCGWTCAWAWSGGMPCASSCSSCCWACLLALSLLSCSPELILSICFWSAFAGCLDRSTLISSGPFVPAPKPDVRLS